MLNKAPTKYKLTTLIRDLTGSDGTLMQVLNTDGTTHWVPARPIGYFSITNRLKYAWMVFTGKADIIIWPGGQ